MIEKSIRQCLDGEGVQDIIKKLNAQDQALFEAAVEDLRKGGDERVKDLWKIDYAEEPPTMEEFISDHYWLGEALEHREDNLGLLPKWRELLIRDFDFDSRVNNLVITGGLGTGKTFIMSIILLYKIILSRLLRKPASYLGLSKGSPVYYVILSISKDVVEQTAFGDIKNFMTMSPFFRDVCHFNPDRKYKDLAIALGNNINLTAGSKGWHLIGRNVVGVCLDEGNWRNDANPDEKAYKLYEEARARLQNRFEKVSGYLPAISILSSSARDQSSFTERAIADINSLNDPNLALIYRYPIYIIRRPELKLSDRWFRVSYGLKNVDPQVLLGWCNEDGTAYKDCVLEEPPSGAQIEIVPDLYFERYKNDTKASLQSFSGIATSGSFRLFPTLIDVEKCLELSTEVPVPTEVARLPISMDDTKQIWDFLDPKKFLTKVASKIQPKRHPEAQRFAHLDLATTGQAGLAVCHAADTTLIKGIFDAESIEPFEEYRVVVEYDFIFSIIPGPNKPISLEKIQKFFFWLRDICGYRFGLITADQFQSVLPLQMLTSRNFLTAVLSVDKTKAPYYAWRDAHTEHRIRCYRHGVLLKEMGELIDGTKKVDHPEPEGSKDVADGCCGAYTNCVSSKTPLRVTEPVLPVLQEGLADEKEPPPVSIPMQGIAVPTKIVYA